MAHSHDVSVCGTYILDILGVPVTEIPPGGGRLLIEEIRLAVAGTAGGTVVPCARLGLKALAVGAVGSDEKADWMLNALEREGIDISLMERMAGSPTSATILPIRPDGSRPVMHARGASARWRIAPEVQAAACRSKILHLGGVGSLLAMDGAPSVALLRDAKAAGCTTTLDLIQARRETLALVEPLLPYVDFFMPSIDETNAMVGTDDPAACARFFIDKGAGGCAISLGADGSFVMTRDGRQFTVPAFEVAVRDTSGCGDSYTGGFIAGLVRDWDLLDCAKLATATAAIVATGLGSGANLVSFEETVKAMNTLPVRKPARA
ncbi:carbohydrate kinase family protein [Bradyrhizobium sp. CCBAU 25338]|uniref:carbohydrate kinase family protein n=1 Tax=Bradyrhizobium sp. CCBAU 25338 TaxID=1641877 RepID=UPI0023049A49|nr:sugar kinase [Bradyrhizobium sp. CCBAU 25338]MDA9532392.1 kinase [Bradyrhizobium sp. CCBAU 25338]